MSDNIRIPLIVISVHKDSFERLRRKRLVKRIVPNATVYSFRDGDEAVEIARKYGCDVLLTDVELGYAWYNSFTVATCIQQLNQYVNIIITTKRKNAQDAFEAFEVFASDYFETPCTRERLERSFANLRFPVQR